MDGVFLRVTARRALWRGGRFHPQGTSEIDAAGLTDAQVAAILAEPAFDVVSIEPKTPLEAEPEVEPEVEPEAAPEPAAKPKPKARRGKAAADEGDAGEGSVAV